MNLPSAASLARRVALTILVPAVALVACAPESGPREPGSSAPAASARKARAARERLQHDQLYRARASWLDEDEAPESLPELQPLPLETPSFDALHYRVHLDFPAASLTEPSFEGEVQLTFRPVRAPMQVLSLDSGGLAIRGVRLLNSFEELRFEARGEKLEIDLGRAYAERDTLTVAVRYGWAGARSRGMYFRSRTGARELEAIYSQSEPELSKYWFPGNALPNDRATFEAFIRVPEPFVAVSNGALVSERREGGFRVSHWSQRVPMVSYLFVVTAGRFASYEETWEGIPVQYFGPTDDQDRLRYSLRNTPDMMTYFSDLVGLRYPYEKYAQTVVPQYQWGGMEHTTATTLTDRTVHGPDEDAELSSDGLAAHELAHQWFGDLVTCLDWSHLWLNEGFATYFDALYQERTRGREQLLEDMADSAGWYFWQEGQDPRPVVFPYYRWSADYYFDGHAYAKGAWVLHMLRGLLGDETLFRGIRHYLYRHQAGLVTTDDFQRALEEVSGRDLGPFFEQWLDRPGYPEFRVSWSHDPRAGRVLLTVAQRQDTATPGGVAGTRPYFAGPIAVEVDGVRRTVELSAQAEQRFELPAVRAPRYVKFNSEDGWLATVATEQPLAAWVAQLRASLDPVARREAAAALGGSKLLPADGATEGERSSALLSCARADASIWVRLGCVDALVALVGAREAIVFGGLPEGAAELAADPSWRIRRAAAALLAKLPASRALESLRRLIQRDPSLSVAVAALEAVGALRQGDAAAPGAYDLAVGQLGRPSFQGRLRSAVLGALAELSDPRALDLGEEHASERYDDETRKAAFALLARLGRAHRAVAGDRALAALEAALAAPGFRVRRSSIEGLVKLGDARAIPALERVRDTDSDDRIRLLAAQAIERLRG